MYIYRESDGVSKTTFQTYTELSAMLRKIFNKNNYFELMRYEGTGGNILIGWGLQ